MVVLRIAGREGPAFPLDPACRNVLGRAEESLVTLADRLASRSHAAIWFDPAETAWHLDDLGSRNGTWLDGVRVTSARLSEGGVIRVGTTELVFRCVEPAVEIDSPEILRLGPPGELEGTAIRRAAAAGEGRLAMLLYQAGIRLLAAATPADIAATTLELAAEFTAAASFGWFTVDDGVLEPVCVVPPGSGLSAALAGPASREAAGGRAVWLTASDGGGLVCIPLMAARPVTVLAASAPGGIREADFDLMLTLASFASAALAGRRSFEATTPPDTTDPLESSGGPTSADGTISLSPEAILAWQSARQDSPVAVPSDAGSLKIEEWERSLALEALRRSAGNVPAAATLLGMSRATLYRRLDSWGLSQASGSLPPE